MLDESKSSGKSAHAEGDGKSDTENVYDHADDHELHGERSLGDSGERQHNAIHEEIDSHAIERAKNDGLVYQNAERATRYEVDSSRSKGDDEVTEEAEQRRRESAIECPRAKQSAGNPLQQGHGLEAEEAVDDERGSNVKDAARKAGP